MRLWQQFVKSGAIENSWPSNNINILMDLDSIEGVTLLKELYYDYQNSRRQITDIKSITENWCTKTVCRNSEVFCLLGLLNHKYKAIISSNNYPWILGVWGNLWQSMVPIMLEQTTTIFSHHSKGTYSSNNNSGNMGEEVNRPIDFGFVWQYSSRGNYQQW